MPDLLEDYSDRLWSISDRKRTEHRIDDIRNLFKCEPYAWGFDFQLELVARYHRICSILIHKGNIKSFRANAKKVSRPPDGRYRDAKERSVKIIRHNNIKVGGKKPQNLLYDY